MSTPYNSTGDVPVPYLNFVGQVGFEPTKPKGDGFTDRFNSPTLTLTHFYLLQCQCSLKSYILNITKISEKISLLEELFC